MAKQVLGRNLETLLGDSVKRTEKTPVTTGVRTLLRGPDARVTMPAPAQATGLPRWYLFAADILLIAVATVVVYASPHPLSWPRMVFCVAAGLLGAALAVGALIFPRSD